MFGRRLRRLGVPGVNSSARVAAVNLMLDDGRGSTHFRYERAQAALRARVCWWSGSGRCLEADGDPIDLILN